MRTHFSDWALCATISLASTINLAAAAKSESPTASAAGSHVELKLPKDGTLAIETVRSQVWKTDREIFDKTGELKKKKDFNGLEALAEKYRKSKATYPTGIWYLNSFYAFLVETNESHNKAAPPAQIELFNEWIKQKPTSPTPRVALVHSWIDYAWEARGSGYADTVSKDGWKLFEERLKNAQAAVKDLDKLQDKDPETYYVKLILANALSFEAPEYNKIFDAAIKFEPTYMNYYSAKMNHLLPRWGGEPGEFEKFISDQANKIGGKAGDIFYAQMVWRFNRDNYEEDEIFKNTKLSWPRAKKGLQFMIDDSKDPLPMEGEYAQLAVIVGDKAAAKDMFDKMGNKFDKWMWYSKYWYVYRRNQAFGNTADVNKKAPDDD